MSNPREHITAVFEDELSGVPLPADFRAEMLREASARRRARTSDGHPRGLAIVAAVLAVAVVATLVVIARAPRITPPVVPATVIPAGALSFSDLTMFGSGGWALATQNDAPGVSAILTTSDGALNWLNVTPKLAKAEGVAAYHAIDTRRAWVATRSAIDGALYVWTTADGGATWSVSNGPSMSPFISSPLFFTDDTHGWLVAAGQPTSQFEQQPISIAATSDGGRTWKLVSETRFPPDVSTTGAPALECGKRAISFVDADRGWLTGGCGGAITFDSTSDGGRTWKAQPLASPDGLPFSTDCGAGVCLLSAPRFAGPGFGYMVLNDYDSVHDSHRSSLYVTVDDGRTWSLRTLPGADTTVTMLDVSTGFAAAGQPGPSGWLYATHDGGRTWKSVAANVQLPAARLDCVSPSNCWALSPDYSQPDATTGLYRTADGGSTWTLLSGAQASPTPSPTPPAQGPFGRTWPVGTVGEVAVTPQAAYALYVPAGAQGPVQGASNEMLARIDRSTGAVITAGPFPGAMTIAAAGSSVWLGHSPAGLAGNPDAETLIQLDQSTLRMQRRVQLPSGAHVPVAALAGSGSLLFLGYGSNLYRLDPADGHVTLRAAITGPVTSVSLDPSGTRLYAGTDGCGPTSSAAVSEWDAARLTRVAVAATGGGCLGGPTVSASKDGVWVSFATGNLGQFEHRRSADLAPMPIAGVLHTNAIQVVAAGGRVWALDPGPGRLACLDPQKGAELAGWTVADTFVVAGDAHGMYAGRTDGLAVLVVDPRCG